MNRSCALTVVIAAGLLAGSSFAPVVMADPPTRAQIQKSENNLKQIALGMINYADTYQGRMPNNINDQNGKALLSWRVSILPFVEEDKLYKEFKLDEPWDSENNKKLIGRMPKLYVPIRVKAMEGETFYQVFTGNRAPFRANKPTFFPASFTDGTSNTGLVFEAGDPVNWTKPADLVYAPDKALPKLGGMFDGEFNVALADGSVIRCKKDADQQQLRHLITPDGGEIIDFDKLKK